MPAFPSHWPGPEARPNAGRFVTLTPVNPDADAKELFRGSHESGSAEEIWRYIPGGPFVDAAAMRDWLRARQALRLGYSFEGIFRQHMIIKGRNRDTAWYAMLDHEWPRIAAAMEHWLYADDSKPLAARRAETPQ